MTIRFVTQIALNKACHKALSKSQKGSHNRGKLITKLGSNKRKLANQRHNFNH